MPEQFYTSRVDTPLQRDKLLNTVLDVSVRVWNQIDKQLHMGDGETLGGIVIGQRPKPEPDTPPLVSGMVTADLSTYGGTIKERILAARANGAKQYIIPVGVWDMPGSDVLSGERFIGASKTGTKINCVDGGFYLRTGVGAYVGNMTLHHAAPSYGTVFTINAPDVIDARLEDLIVTQGTGVGGNGMSFGSAGIRGLRIERCRFEKWNRMAIEFLNQGDLGNPNRPYFEDTIVRDCVFNDPTGLETPTFSPAMSVDGFIKNFLIDNCVIRGGVGTAVEVIEAENVTIRNMRTERCKAGVFVASNVRPIRGLVVDGWNDVDPVGRTTFSIPSTIGAELKRIKSSSSCIYIGPADDVKLIENDISAGSLATGEPGLIFSGGGGAVGGGIRVQGGRYRITDCAADMAVFNFGEPTNGVPNSIQGARLERGAHQNFWYFGAAANDKFTAKTGMVYLDDKGIRTTPDRPAPAPTT